MKASVLSSSATDPTELDLLATGRLPPLPTAWLEGRGLDLLEPLRLLPPNGLPEGVAPAVERGELATALAQANAAYGHPAAERLAERFADPATRVVVTGQQPGLYGGPLLTLSKMAAAVRQAETLEAAGERAVAVFWVATEDHDWAEVAQADLLARQDLLRLELGEDPAPLTPVGMRTFGNGLKAVEEQLLEAYPGEHAAGWLAPVAGWYRPDARFGEAFCRLLVHLLGERAPLMLDSMLPELKQAQRPWLRRLVVERRAVARVQAESNERLRARGFPLQVRPQPGTSPLFLLHGQARRRIEWRGEDRYGLRGLEGFEAPVEQLLETLDENPAVVSPGVLARPAIQDAALGTTLQVMGPSELSYMAQVASLYPLLGLTAPWTSLRPQALLLEERQAGQLAALGVSLGELIETPVEELLGAKLGEDFVAPVKTQVEALVAELEQPVRELDASLVRPFEKTRDQITRALETLGGKVKAAGARQHEVELRRLQAIRATCLPGETLQERRLSVVHFLGRYGPSFATALVDQLGLDPRKLHLIRP